MFGENLKYVLTLVVLTWMAFTLPTVRAAFGEPVQYSASVATIEQRNIVSYPLHDRLMQGYHLSDQYQADEVRAMH